MKHTRNSSSSSLHQLRRAHNRKSLPVFKSLSSTNLVSKEKTPGRCIRSASQATLNGSYTMKISDTKKSTGLTHINGSAEFPKYPLRSSPRRRQSAGDATGNAKSLGNPVVRIVNPRSFYSSRFLNGSATKVAQGETDRFNLREVVVKISPEGKSTRISLHSPKHSSQSEKGVYKLGKINKEEKSKSLQKPSNNCTSRHSMQTNGEEFEVKRGNSIVQKAELKAIRSNSYMGANKQVTNNHGAKMSENHHVAKSSENCRAFYKRKMSARSADDEFNVETPHSRRSLNMSASSGSGERSHADRKRTRYSSPYNDDKSSVWQCTDNNDTFPVLQDTLPVLPDTIPVLRDTVPVLRRITRTASTSSKQSSSPFSISLDATSVTRNTGGGDAKGSVENGKENSGEKVLKVMVNGRSNGPMQTNIQHLPSRDEENTVSRICWDVRSNKDENVSEISDVNMRIVDRIRDNDHKKSDRESIPVNLRPKRSASLSATSKFGAAGIHWREESQLQRALMASIRSRKQKSEENSSFCDTESNIGDVSNICESESLNDSEASCSEFSGKISFKAKRKFPANASIPSGAKSLFPQEELCKKKKESSSVMVNTSYLPSKAEDFLTFLCFRGTRIMSADGELFLGADGGSKKDCDDLEEDDDLDSISLSPPTLTPQKSTDHLLDNTHSSSPDSLSRQCASSESRAVKSLGSRQKSRGEGSCKRPNSKKGVLPLKSRLRESTQVVSAATEAEQRRLKELTRVEPAVKEAEQRKVRESTRVVSVAAEAEQRRLRELQTVAAQNQEKQGKKYEGKSSALNKDIRLDRDLIENKDKCILMKESGNVVNDMMGLNNSTNAKLQALTRESLVMHNSSACVSSVQQNELIHKNNSDESALSTTLSEKENQLKLESYNAEEMEKLDCKSYNVQKNLTSFLDCPVKSCLTQDTDFVTTFGPGKLPGIESLLSFSSLKLNQLSVCVENSDGDTGDKTVDSDTKTSPETVSSDIPTNSSTEVKLSSDKDLIDVIKDAKTSPDTVSSDIPTNSSTELKLSREKDLIDVIKSSTDDGIAVVPPTKCRKIDSEAESGVTKKIKFIKQSSVDVEESNVNTNNSNNRGQCSGEKVWNGGSNSRINSHQHDVHIDGAATEKNVISVSTLKPDQIRNGVQGLHKESVNGDNKTPTFYATVNDMKDFGSYLQHNSNTMNNRDVFLVAASSSWQADCNISQHMRFSVSTQYVNKLYRRWGTNSEQLACIAKQIESERSGWRLENIPVMGGIEIDLVSLLEAIQTCGGIQKVIDSNLWFRISDMLHLPKKNQDLSKRLYDIYCSYLLSYDALSSPERRELEELVISERKRNKITEADEPCCVKSRSKTLGEFYSVAHNISSAHFPSGDPTLQQVEKHYWQLLENPNRHVSVLLGEVTQSRGDKKNSSDVDQASVFKSLDKNGVLKYLEEDIIGVNKPLMCVGMMFGTTCWTRDRHMLPVVHYLHTGADIVWYCISEDQEEKFKSAMCLLTPELIQPKSQCWLPENSVMVSPHLLEAQGVRVSRVVQSQGQFVVILPGTFVASISTGYNITEKMNFSSVAWLEKGCRAAGLLHQSFVEEKFCMEKLLMNILLKSNMDNKEKSAAIELLKPMICDELEARRLISEMGITRKSKFSQSWYGQYEKKMLESEQNDSGKNLKSDDPHVTRCPHSKKICYFSFVEDETRDTICSLREALTRLARRKNYSSIRVVYRHHETELKKLIASSDLRKSSN